MTTTGLTLKTATNTIGEGYTFHSPARTITDAYFLFFAGITGDTGRSHIDAEYAKRTIVLVEQGCRFLKPVVAGDTLAPEFEVEKIWEDGHRTFCRLKTKVVNQRAEVVLDGFHLYRVIPPKTSV